MSKMPWFRAYTKMVDDEKLRLLAFEDRWHFVALLCLKGSGVLDQNDPLLMRKVGVKLGLDSRTLDEVVRRLAEVGLIDRETLQPIKWDELQMRSDADLTAAERKRRQRQRQREGDTDASRVTGTDVTRTDTDTDIEEEIPTAVDQRVEAETAAPAATPKRKRADPTATRLPAGWVLPKAWGDWAMQERPDLSAEDVRREAECFADYWHAKAGADARKADWLATWRNWVRRANGGPAAVVVRGGTSRPPGPANDTPTETYAQRAARQRMEEVAPMAARKQPGSAFDAAQRFMQGEVIDVAAVPKQLARVV